VDLEKFFFGVLYVVEMKLKYKIMRSGNRELYFSVSNSAWNIQKY